MPLRLTALVLFVLALVAPALASSDDAPAWLSQAAAVSVPSYDKDIPAVVLRREQIVTVADDGHITTVTSYAVRVLNREGREYAEAEEHYLTKAGKIREIHAWLIRPNGTIKKYGKDDVIDQISDPNDIYDEYRLKRIDGERDADVGAVFGYQITSEERPLFNHDLYPFQEDRLPALSSRYTLVLPANWRAIGITFNHARIEPSVTGSTYSWELRDLPPMYIEPSSPKFRNLVPLIAVTYSVADSGITASSKAFENWVQVSRWATALHDPQAVPDQAVSAKARELTVNSKTELDRIKAIGHFVQNLQYISIDIGVGHGNGYRPHAATQVLAKAYGDCKDKANLMRTMLSTLGITAYPVAIYLGDASHVREEWASPDQFNHCIVAIKVSDDTQAATVIKHATLGRLLIFDATDESTNVGDLPSPEQGSFALVIAGDAGALMKMPILPPESSRVERQADVTLQADGSITASVREQASGQAAAANRRVFHHLSRPEYVKLIEGWVTYGATASRVTRVEPVDDGSGGGFALNLDFSAPAYGQLMQNRLLVFKPAIISRQETLELTDLKRKYPVVMESRAFTETVRVKLPAGFEVDELPDPVKLDAPFGSYATTYNVKNGELVFSRTMAVRSGTISPDQYEVVRKFFEQIRTAEKAPVVLARK